MTVRTAYVACSMSLIPKHTNECVMYLTHNKAIPDTSASALYTPTPAPPLPPPRKYFIPNPTAKGDQSASEEPEGETLSKHWLVKDIMDFENIGFTYVRGTIRYLACADCEVGPVGWHDITNKKEYYLAASRVQYSDK